MKINSAAAVILINYGGHINLFPDAKIHYRNMKSTKEQTDLDVFMSIH